MVVASISRILTSPSVANIEIKNVPVSYSFADDFASPSSVIHSSVLVTYIDFISDIFTQGIFPSSQYSSFFLEGVPPDDISKISPKQTFGILKSDSIISINCDFTNSSILFIKSSYAFLVSLIDHRVSANLLCSGIGGSSIVNSFKCVHFTRGDKDPADFPTAKSKKKSF